MAIISVGNLKITQTGASHTPTIGLIAEGIPQGITVDRELISQLVRRRSAGGAFGSGRHEGDTPLCLSGIAQGHTSGEPLEILFENNNISREDYDSLEYLPRPSHADYGAYLQGALPEDIRGGGVFSARATLPLVWLGGVLMSELTARGITIRSHILRVADYTEKCYSAESTVIPNAVEYSETRLSDILSSIRAEGDSVSGVAEVGVWGMPSGIGGEYFSGLEGHIAQLVYAVPAVKGLCFGADLFSSSYRGSDYNDAFAIRDGQVVTVTNNAGGILGGISTGMPLTFRVALKPTPSIALPQQTVNLDTMQEQTIRITGRHDVCLLPRALPVLEAITAIAIFSKIVK